MLGLMPPRHIPTLPRTGHTLLRSHPPTNPQGHGVQREPDINPDRLLDNLGREAVAAIADLGHHRWLRLKVTDGKPNGDVTMPPVGL